MKNAVFVNIPWVLLGMVLVVVWAGIGGGGVSGQESPSEVKLPEPKGDGSVSVEAAIRLRRSVRRYAGDPLTLGDVSQLLWAVQGGTASSGYRAAPSAGALYPLEVDVLCGRVEGLEPGIYRYNPKAHSLSRRLQGDRRSQVSSAALGQSAVAQAPVVLVISAVFERTLHKYGERGIRYIHTEAGHAAQNVCLQAVALKLGSVHIGAFQDDQVAKALELQHGEKPLILLPIGRVAP